MMERKQRRVRPSLVGLEGRTLLNGSKTPSVHAQAIGSTITTQTTNLFAYTTGDGARVRVVLSGPGVLTGTALDATGNLNLVFAGTSTFTQINGTVRGGSRQAALGTIRNANIPLTTLTGVGGELIGRINLPNFNLVSGGNINLTAGVNELTLNSVAGNSQMHLRDTPLNTTLGISTTVDPLTGAGLGYAGNQPYHTSSATSVTTTSGTTTTTNSGTTGSTSSNIATGISGVTNPGTLDPTITGFGSLAVGAINGATPIINTIGNGQNVRGTPGLTQSQVSFGRTLAYAFETTNVNAIRLNSVAGSFVPGANLIEPRDLSLAGFGHVRPPGVILNINHINGNASSTASPLGHPNIYGFDPATATLIRFDATSGAVLGSIAVPGVSTATGVGGVALARNGSEQVVLVGSGMTVQAYDATSGVFVGQFVTKRNVGGIATTSGGTVLIDSTQQPDGIAQTIDVQGSLAVGTTVPLGATFSPAREFVLAGGATGVPGRDNIYALGAGFFDTAQPNLLQAGILTLTPSSSGTLSEVTRTVLTSQGIAVPAANGTIANDASRALGSIESNLALDAGVTNSKNVLILLNPITLATQGTVGLNYPNPLSDLSESFHPEIAGTALIDVQGNIQTFTAKTVNGLILNDEGNLNLLAARTATNSSVVGLPFGHVNIANRSNVSIVTNSRLTGDRGDVTVDPTIRPIGPLTLP